MLVFFNSAFGKKKSFYQSKLLAMNLDNFVNGVLNKKTSAVFIYDGRSGLGKTTKSCQDACYIHNKVREWYKKKGIEKEAPEFTLDNMCWTPQRFIEILEDKENKLKKGSIVILDESMIISNRSAMSEINKAVVIMMSMIRSKQIFVIFNVNSIFDLDRNLPLHRADMLINLYPRGGRFADRGAYQVIPSNKGQIKHLYIVGKKHYDYSKARKALNDTFSSFFPFDEEEYEKRKQQAISNYFNKDTKQPQIKTSRDSCIKYIKDNLPGTSVDDLSRIAGVTTRTIYRILEN